MDLRSAGVLAQDLCRAKWHIGRLCSLYIASFAVITSGSKKNTLGKSDPVFICRT